MAGTSGLRRGIWKIRLRQTGRLAKLEQLRRSQWLTPGEAAAEQQERLGALLTHAAVHVPYYREVLLEAGAVTEAALAAALASGERPPGAPPPAPAVDLSRFERVPLLDRDTLRARFDDLKSDDLAQRRWFDNYTGGSTGEPVHFIQDRTYREWVFASKMLFDEWTGLRPGDPQVRLWGSERDVLQGGEEMRVGFGRWLRNELWLNAYVMTAERMRDYVARIDAFRPVQIVGYAEPLYALARFAEQEGLDIHAPRGVMSAADVLEPVMRETMERVYRAPVFDRYGSREVADAACECERHEGLHVCLPIHVVEVLRADGTPAASGETGELVVTLLSNHAMPLIRYRIGDMGAKAGRACSCGRGWPLLSDIAGRIGGMFVTADGGLVDPGLFTMSFYGNDLVAGFQMVQETVGHIRMTIVPAPGKRDEITEAWLDEIRDVCRVAMRAPVEVTIELTEALPKTPSGKYRHTLSKVASPWLRPSSRRWQTAGEGEQPDA